MNVISISHLADATNLTLQPNKICTLDILLKSIEDEEKVSPDFEWQVFGGDIGGGFAYYGVTEKIESLTNKIHAYLNALDDNDLSYQAQHYAIWNFEDGTSLLTLYDDYHNPHPQTDNLFRVHFGAWADDEVLPNVLSEFYGFDYENAWLVGENVFSKDNPEHMKLLEQMKDKVNQIYPNYA